MAVPYQPYVTIAIAVSNLERSAAFYRDTLELQQTMFSPEMNWASFDSVWSLDSTLHPAEMTRVARPDATLCLCAEVPADGRGGFEAVIDEWAASGWDLTSHKSMTLEAVQAWREAEAKLASRRQYFEPRYGNRGYLAQLDLLADMVVMYERGGVGHGLFVFTKKQ